jgi:hypothetical protein
VRILGRLFSFLRSGWREGLIISGDYLAQSGRAADIVEKALQRKFRISGDSEMLRLECTSRLSPEKVIEELKGFFAEGGLGLNLKEESPGCVTFEGGGGYVTASLCQEGRETRVDMVTQEWDYHVKQFAARLR